MKISNLQFLSSKSTVIKATLILMMTATISVLSSTSALADRGEGHGRNNRGNYNEHGDWHGNNEHGDWRGNHFDNGYGYGYRPDYRYGYAQPVYVPPPIYNIPMQSPGISIVLPLNFRR